MARQRYPAGQVVYVAPQSLSGPPTLDNFRIVRRYPVADRPDLYWVESLVDPSQRMVPANELSNASPGMAGQWRADCRDYAVILPVERAMAA
jgi:hypothetical protein